MKTLKQTCPIELSYLFPYKKEELLFFDIETTGLSADISSLYLIGCLYYSDNSWELIQWFADDYRSEALLLCSFFTFLKDYTVLIHYNGSGFDIPYINKKCLQYNLPYDFSSLESFDIYRKIFPYKKIFDLPNLKQKTLETFLDLERKDIYDGGQLISIYSRYIHEKFMRQPNENELLELLLLHNKEDILGMTKIACFLYYIDLFEHVPQTISCMVSKSTLRLSIAFDFILPKPISWEQNGIQIHFTDQVGTFEIPLYEGELKYFYTNYKDYFYLSKEDCAIHKSVAQFVEKEYKSKAKASNCYTRRIGIFLPQMGLSSSFPSFQKEYKDKNKYLELTDTFLSDKESLLQYAGIIIGHT